MRFLTTCLLRSSVARVPRLLVGVIITVALVVSGGCAVSRPPVARPTVPITSSAATDALALHGVTIVDVTDGTLRPGQTVVIVDTRIEAMGAAGAVRVPVDAQVIDARGKYLIPGLWDMHIHPMWDSDVFFPLLIFNGVTGIRDAGTPVPLKTVRQWRREVEAGARVGPRQVVAGRSPDRVAGDSLSPNLQVTTPERARQVVDSLKAAGADFLKVHLVSPPVYFALAAEARRVGLPFGGHVPGDTRPEISAITASDSGARVIDHSHLMQGEGRCMGDSANVARCQTVAERFRHNGTWVVPTLIVHSGRAPHTYRWRRYWPQTLRRGARGKPGDETAPPTAVTSAVPPKLRMDIMHQVGMPIVTGTDAASVFPGVPPGFSLHDEMADLVWAGLTPLAALQAATLNPATLLNATDSLGTVALGKLADLVLLDANPLIDITNTTKIRAVVANGRYFDRAALDAILADLERTARRP